MSRVRPLFYVQCIEDDDGPYVQGDAEDGDGTGLDYDGSPCPRCKGTGKLANFKPDSNDQSDNALTNPTARHSSNLKDSRRKEKEADAIAGLFNTAAAVHHAKGNHLKATRLVERGRRIRAGKSPIPFTIDPIDDDMMETY